MHFYLFLDDLFAVDVLSKFIGIEIFYFINADLFMLILDSIEKESGKNR